MAKTASHARRHEGAAPRPAWEVVALAAAGLGVALHLSIAKLAQSAPLLCGAGGSCEIVQSSRYAVLLGMPTALWGVALYAVLGVLAARSFTRRRWLWAFALASAGVAFSPYLTSVSLLVLGAACGWCLTSAVIVVALLAALLWRRPAPSARPALCAQANVRSFPTWTILGNRREDVTSLDTLATLSGSPHLPARAEPGSERPRVRHELAHIVVGQQRRALPRCA